MAIKGRWAALALIAIYLAAGLIEPCDGHSCKGDEWTNTTN